MLGAEGYRVRVREVRVLGCFGASLCWLLASRVIAHDTKRALSGGPQKQLAPSHHTLAISKNCRRKSN